MTDLLKFDQYDFAVANWRSGDEIMGMYVKGNPLLLLPLATETYHFPVADMQEALRLKAALRTDDDER